MPCRVGVMLLLLAFVPSARAQTPPPSIWGRAILSQPFDKQPFHEVAIPDWLNDLTGVTYCFSVMAQADREKAAAAGSEISELGFADPLFVYYPSEYLKHTNPAVPAADIGKRIADYKRLGVRILGGVPPGLIAEVYAAHPEWRSISTDTAVIPSVDLATNPVGGGLCLLGPWGDRLIDILCEILTKYPDVDAFTFDGLHHGAICYCKSCRDAYRRDTGLEIPKVDMADPAFRRHLYWRDRQLEALVERMQTRIKAIKPKVALLTWTTNAGRFGHFLDIPRNMPARMNLLLDAPDQEFWMDETNRGNTVIPAFANAVIWAASNHRVAFSSPYLFSHGNPYGPDSFPAHEVLRRTMLALTYGARPSVALATSAPLRQPVLDALKEVRRRKPWITSVTDEPWAALLLSDDTRVFYGRESGRMEERYLANVLGFFRTGIEEHLPVTVIQDWNLNTDDLARYRVLILPNAACLTDAQVAAIRTFVQNGGGLVATVDTSLCDEYGELRKDFLLADLFGAHCAGIPLSDGAKVEPLDVNFAKGIDANYWERRKNVFQLRLDASPIAEDARLREYLGADPVTLRGQAVAVRDVAPDAAAAAHFGPKDTGQYPHPAILARTVGKGRVVYMPAAIDAAYYLYSYPYQRILLANAVRWAAAAPPPIAVEAPMCVHATSFRQHDAKGDRLIVHLFNDVNTAGGHAKPDEDVPLREETIPIHDIRVRLTGYDIERVHLEPGGTAAAAVRQGAATVVSIPPLAIHTMVVAELRRGGQDKR